MINFSELPQESPNMLPAPDVYLAKIVGTEMKQPSDASKPPYLNVKLQLTDHAGKSSGTVYDMLFDSDKQLLMYKLGRFIAACGIPLAGQMELKDLAKLVINKTIAVDIKIDVSKDPKYGDKAVVDVFSREAYYPAEQFDEIWGIVHKDATPVTGDEDFMQVPDSAGQGNANVEY